MAAKSPSLDSLLECIICLNEYDDPRILPCGHTLCCKCLDQHIRASARDGEFFCPTCRHKCEVTPKGATAFPKNFLLNSLKEIKQHEAVTRIASKCNLHPTLVVDMYCDTCRIPVCNKCCLWKHKEHAYREIAEASKESKTLLSKLTDTATNISSRLDGNLNQLDASEKDITRDCDEACRQVSKNAEEIRSLVTKKEKSAVHVIRQAQGRALAQLGIAYKKAEINKAAVDSLLSYIEALVASDNVANQVGQARVLQEQLGRHEVAPMQSVTLQVHLERKVNSLSALNSMLGAISVNEANVTQDSMVGAVAEQSRASLGSHLLEVIPKLGIGAISGLVMMGDCVYVTGFRQPYLWIYNFKTNNEKQHGLTGLSATGMTLVGGDALVITDYNSRLHRIKTNQDMEIIEHVVKDIPFQPSGVSFSSSSNKLLQISKTTKLLCLAYKALWRIASR